MALSNDRAKNMPVKASLDDFDKKSGSLTERLIYNYRPVVIAVCVVLTVVLGVLAARLEIKASYRGMMPQSQKYVQNYLKYAKSLGGLGSSVRIVVTNKNGNIFDPKYLATLHKINNEIYLAPGVDRSFVKSLWMPVVRWTEITADGYKGGPVMPEQYDGSPKAIQQLHKNVQRSGIVGSLVSDDYKSSMIFVPLITSGDKKVDYRAFYHRLEALYRYQSQGVQIHIIGFAKLIGDLIAGTNQVLSYFLYAALLAALCLLFYTRSALCTVLVVGCSAIAVVWQLGVVQALGFALDPFSVLMPFLIFAIGVSHGSQMMNGVLQDIGSGTHKYIAARYTFRRLYFAGVTAVVADVVGFAVLAVIDIPAIRNLAAAASIGVAMLIITNLVLLPVLLSYTGVRKSTAIRSQGSPGAPHPVVNWFARFTERRRAIYTIAVAALLGAGGWVVAQHLQVGDLDAGAPELRPNSAYNRDIAYITKHYNLSTDQFAVIVATPPQGLVDYKTLIDMDRLEQILRGLPGVQTTVSIASEGRKFTSVGYEGNLKWETISRDPFIIQDALNDVSESDPELFNRDLSVTPIIAYLSNHKAGTLRNVVSAVNKFAATHNSDHRKFLLAAGTAGIEAATNIAVGRANHVMLGWVYAAVILLCLITFRNWRAVVVAVIPLMLTTVLCEALMVLLGIGVKVATLPVTALGVGIGVDYALYLLAMHLMFHRQGYSVRESYIGALRSTGKVVGLIGFMLSTAVLTWAWSPIKFQADMGVLLGFMFLLNMLGALILVPSLATFLLPQKNPTTEADDASGEPDSQHVSSSDWGRAN